MEAFPLQTSNSGVAPSTLEPGPRLSSQSLRHGGERTTAVRLAVFQDAHSMRRGWLVAPRRTAAAVRRGRPRRLKMFLTRRHDGGCSQHWELGRSSEAPERRSRARERDHGQSSSRRCRNSTGRHRVPGRGATPCNGCRSGSLSPTWYRRRGRGSPDLRAVRSWNREPFDGVARTPHGSPRLQRMVGVTPGTRQASRTAPRASRPKAARARRVSTSFSTG